VGGTFVNVIAVKMTSKRQHQHETDVEEDNRTGVKKLTNDRRRTPSDGKSSHCLWQGELKIGQSETRIACGGHVC
jgi:hypothetical protein